jgi:3-oxoacyl-[acyl-carrier-protein] synthase-3
MATYAHIVGWGKYIPEKVVTNDDIAQFMDTSDGWIKSRTGISERRFANEDETTASMAIAAAQLALDQARITPSTVDLIIVATLSPEYIFPSTACLVQDAIGAIHAGAYDLSAACAGFIYGLAMAAAMIQSGAIKVALVIGSETVSRFLDDQDRTTYSLFGDGAGALVLQAAEEPGGVLATILGADGSGAEHLVIPAGGSKLPTCQESVDNRLHYIKMNGREVYRFATRVMGRAAKQACARAGIDLAEIDLFIPHQANIRIIESARKYLKIGEDKVFTNLHKYGNTSTASIPIALCEAIEEGRIQAKDKLVMVGFGGGLTWGASVVQWGVPMPYRPYRWWYRALRWMVYRWARIRSVIIRTWRHIENIFPLKNGNGARPPIEEQQDEMSETRSTNGAKPQPTKIAPELPLTQPAETEEKVLETGPSLDEK